MSSKKFLILNILFIPVIFSFFIILNFYFYKVPFSTLWVNNSFIKKDKPKTIFKIFLLLITHL